MNGAKNKLDGATNQAKGSLKEGVGKVLGNHKLQSKGTTDRLKGRLQSAEGKIKDAAASAVKKVKGALSSSK